MHEKKQDTPRKGVSSQERREQARGPAPSPAASRDAKARVTEKDETDRVAGKMPKTQEEIQAEKAATGRTAQGGPEGAEGVDWRDQGIIPEPGAPKSQEQVQKESAQKK